MDTPAEPEDVIVVTEAEFAAAVQAALDDLGLTYDDLRDQAARHEFDSLRARKLWLLIGGTR
ncbi:hypothetical protein D5H75_38415 [Bailinhaonella thermotolerans]|uniref:Uncharacterized protein n=2 Tax=Bailinhaonella thermotolerans TaxID=1070861 RepID=A0A3A3ZZI8_9ACTN|nr:hypothetical protein D5H75_38415 [Bailinhaonella thermotolerans]